MKPPSKPLVVPPAVAKPAPAMAKPAPAVTKPAPAVAKPAAKPVQPAKPQLIAVKVEKKEEPQVGGGRCFCFFQFAISVCCVCVHFCSEGFFQGFCKKCPNPPFAVALESGGQERPLRRHRSKRAAEGAAKGSERPKWRAGVLRCG